MAYVDSKLAELRSAKSAAQAAQLPSSPFNSDDVEGKGSTFYRPLTNSSNRAKVGEVEEVDLSTLASTTKHNQPRRPRRQPAVRGAQDLARDAIVDQIMRESQLSHYERSSSRHSQSDDDEGVDNDTAVAEAFKAEFLANIEEAQLRRRQPAPPTKGAKGSNMSSGPKLGGSRAQRERMKRAEEEAKASGKK